MTEAGPLDLIDDYNSDVEDGVETQTGNWDYICQDLCLTVEDLLFKQNALELHLQGEVL